jgi:hypothetical protein
MSAKRRRTMEDEDVAQELLLDSSSEGENMSYDSDQDESQQDNTEWRENMQSGHGAPVIQRFTGGSSGICHNAAPTINKDSTPLSVFMLFFLEIIQLLVVETNRYYHQYLESLNDRRSPLLDMTLKEMFSFLAILQMGHDIRDTPEAYWSTAEQFSMPFFGKTMKRGRFCHILRYLYFTDNRDEPDKRF